MPCLGIKCKKGNVTKLQCLNCEGCEDFPLPFRKAFYGINFRHKPAQICVSNLCGCPRQEYLKLTQDYYIDMKGLVAMNVGIGVHKLFEGVGAVSEQYMEWITPKGNKCMGFFDSLTIERDLYDLKTTTSVKYKKEEIEGRDAHQIRIYATILNIRYQIELRKLKLLYLGLNWEKSMFEKEVEYKDMTNFINERTDLLQEAINNKQVPKGEPMWLEWECNYCNFKEGCEYKK